jgi:hypothetical protein
MLYYTVSSLPKTLTRLSTYEIDEGSRVIFRAEYPGTQGVHQLGLFVRYIPYSVPASLAPDIYTFRATLTLGGVSQTQFWNFAVARREILGRQ